MTPTTHAGRPPPPAGAPRRLPEHCVDDTPDGALSTEQPLRVAMIGYGFMGAAHSQGWRVAPALLRPARASPR